MAGPGRPAKTIQDLNKQIGVAGELTETVVAKRPKEKKVTDTYIFEMVGTFPKDPENGTIRYPHLGLESSQLVYDEDTGTNRMARIIRGHSSIWVDEQKDIEQKYADRNKPNLTFVNGQLVIPATDANVVKFLLLRSDFEGCKHPAVNRKTRYKLINTELDASKRLEKEKIIKDAYDKAWEASMDDLLPHAKYLGISMTNDKGLEKSPDDLRADYVNKAKAQPDLFLRTFNNPKVKMYGLVRKAFESDIIVYVDGQAIWNDTKVVICQVPHGKSAPDYLSELMLTKEGLDLRTRLENL